MKVTVLIWVLRNRFLVDKFRNYHKVTHLYRSNCFSSCQELCLLHFAKFSTPETTCWIVYGQITKIFTEWKIVKWPLLFKRHRAAPSVFTHRCKNARRIVWNRFRSCARIRWLLNGDFLDIFTKKVIFDTWSRVKNFFDRILTMMLEKQNFWHTFWRPYTL